MLTTDKLITFGVNASISAALYCISGQRLPTKALCASLGGMTASTLFQAYYPEYCSQIQEKCGKNITRAITWLYPGVIFAAGYAGGLPNDINLFATAVFVFFQHGVSSMTWKEADKRYFEEIKSLRKQANENIKEGQLHSAGQLIEQAVAAIQNKPVVYQEGLFDSVYLVDCCKKSLSKAYLGLSTPKLDEAERWARCIEGSCNKSMALKTLLAHLIKNGGEESKVLKLLKECKELAQPYGSYPFLKLRFQIAVQYDKPEILEAVKEAVSSLSETTKSMNKLLSLIEKGVELNKPEFAKICIQKAEEFMDKLRDNDVWYKYSSKSTFRPSYRRNAEGLKSDVLFNLVYFATALRDLDKAESLLKNEKLKGVDRLFAEIQVGYAYGVEFVEKAKEHFKKAYEAKAAISSPTSSLEASKILTRLIKEFGISDF